MIGQKKKQVWFETDLGYYATKKALLKSGLITADSQDWRGRLTFHFKGFLDFTLQVTTKGKVNITYPETSDYSAILDRLRPHLLNAEGNQAKIISKRILDFSRTASSKNYYKVMYRHSKNLILSDKKHQGPEDWSPNSLLGYLAFWEKYQAKLRKSKVNDAYLIVPQLLQHIQEGYPEINSIVQKYRQLSAKKEMPSPSSHFSVKDSDSESTIDDLIDTFALKFHGVVREVRDGKLLLGNCDGCLSR